MGGTNEKTGQMIKSIHFHIFHAENLNKTNKLGFSVQ